MRRKPLIAVGCCFWEAEFLHGSKQGSGDKYIRAVSRYANVIPLLVPALTDCYGPNWVDSVLPQVSGLMLTGSPSNIHPQRYGVEPDEKRHPPYDLRRDDAVFSLIEGALKYKIPILGVCRGHQELNVFFGGSLSPDINNEKTYHGFPTDILKDESVDKSSMAYQDIKYGPAHPVHIRENGVLHDILGKNEIIVNSCHYQGIDRLGSDLIQEAISPDGRVEALSMKNTDQFLLSVQWHPEYKPEFNNESQKIYQAFGKAVEEFKCLKNEL